MVKRAQKIASNTTSGLSNNVFLMGLAIVFVMLAGMFFYIIDRPIIILGNSEIGIRQITGIEYESTCRTNTSHRLPPPPNPNVLEDPYVPPVKKTPGYIAPINTQPIRDEYTQVGILKRKSEIYRDGGNELIIPLMGRQLYSRRDKFQYYTISNTGNINTKLPIRHKGQNGMSEYGCDEIFSRDVVFVNGYDDYFIATIYENNAFIYTPNI